MNKKLFTEFVREHQSGLRSFIRMIGVQQDSVDDLAQETFMVAFKEWGRFHKDEDFGKWLRGIARNLVRNEIRKNARRNRLMNDELTDHLLAMAEQDQDQSKYESSEIDNLRDCIEQLPPKSRRLIAGRYYDEWNASFLSDQFKMSSTAVRLTLMRLRKSLKACIEKRTQHA